MVSARTNEVGKQDNSSGNTFVDGTVPALGDGMNRYAPSLFCSNILLLTCSQQF